MQQENSNSVQICRRDIHNVASKMIHSRYDIMLWRAIFIHATTLV